MYKNSHNSLLLDQKDAAPMPEIRNVLIPQFQQDSIISQENITTFNNDNSSIFCIIFEEFIKPIFSTKQWQKLKKQKLLPQNCLFPKTEQEAIKSLRTIAANYILQQKELLENLKNTLKIRLQLIKKWASIKCINRSAISMYKALTINPLNQRIEQIESFLSTIENFIHDYNANIKLRNQHHFKKPIESIEDFCKHTIDPKPLEANEIHLHALRETLNFATRIIHTTQEQEGYRIIATTKPKSKTLPTLNIIHIIENSSYAAFVSELQ